MHLAWALVLASAGGAWGQSSPARAPIGGRPAALGHAYSALADDAYAPIWNPAGLAVLPVAQGALMHAGGSGSSARQTAAVALPFDQVSGGGLAADWQQGQAMYGLAYGRRWGAAALGAAGRYLDGDGGPGRPHAWAADVAGLYRFDERLSVGVVGANLGGRPPALQEPGFRRPEARLGAGYIASRRFTYSLEAVMARQGDAGVRSGLEVRLLDWACARVGVDSTDQGGGSGLGVTTGIGLAWAGQGLDVAYLPRGKDSLEQLSLVVRFGRVPEISFPDEVAQPSQPAAKPSRVRRPDSLSFHLEPAAAAPAAPAPPRSASPSSSDDVHLPQPVQPGMIWLNQN